MGKADLPIIVAIGEILAGAWLERGRQGENKGLATA